MAGMDRNRIMGMAVIGGGLLVVLGVVFFVFRGSFFAPATTTKIQNAGDTLSVVVKSDDKKTAPLSITFVIRNGQVFRRPVNVFDPKDTSSGNVVVQINARVATATNLDSGSNTALVAETFMLQYKTPTLSQFIPNGIAPALLRGDQDFPFATLDSFQLNAGGSGDLTLLYIVPRDANEFKLMVNSLENENKVSYIIPLNVAK